MLIPFRKLVGEEASSAGWYASLKCKRRFSAASIDGAIYSIICLFKSVHPFKSEKNGRSAPGSKN